MTAKVSVLREWMGSRKNIFLDSRRSGHCASNNARRAKPEHRTMTQAGVRLFSY
jgi:hypothetical protein